MAEQRQQMGMKQAVAIAMNTIRDLYPKSALEDLLLEEVLYVDADREWDVTLGFARPYDTMRYGSVGATIPQAKPRAYKRFKIDADTGVVQGMLDGRIDAD